MQEQTWLRPPQEKGLFVRYTQPSREWSMPEECVDRSLRSPRLCRNHKRQAALRTRYPRLSPCLHVTVSVSAALPVCSALKQPACSFCSCVFCLPGFQPLFLLILPACWACPGFWLQPPACLLSAFLSSDSSERISLAQPSFPQQPTSEVAGQLRVGCHLNTDWAKPFHFDG